MSDLLSFLTLTRGEIIAKVSELTQVQQVVFGELLLERLGHCDDHYEGWALGPSCVTEILFAKQRDYIIAYLRTINQWDEAFREQVEVLI